MNKPTFILLAVVTIWFVSFASTANAQGLIDQGAVKSADDYWAQNHFETPGESISTQNALDIVEQIDRASMSPEDRQRQRFMLTRLLPGVTVLGVIIYFIYFRG